jgi:acetate kinase
MEGGSSAGLGRNNFRFNQPSQSVHYDQPLLHKILLFGKWTGDSVLWRQAMQILVLNAGSSSIKFSVIEAESEQLVLSGQADWSALPAKFVLHRPGEEAVKATLQADTNSDAVTNILHEIAPIVSSLGQIGAVGHRVVHGGDAYTGCVRIDDNVKKTLTDLCELAPLHNPISLEGIRAAEESWPNVPQFASFDTAFHATLSESARTYAVPHIWTRDWKLRRYGFHGLSHAYCTLQAAKVLGRPVDDLRLIICHLGHGCSVTAVRDGVSVDTSMGFTPLDGLVMATRSGSIDPGLLTHVMRHKGLNAEDVDRVLNRESGLLGVSGVSADMRQILQGARNGHEACRLALDVYVRRLRQTIGAMFVTLGGLDALVFTAGVGENAVEVREAVSDGLTCIGIELDKQANQTCAPDADIAVMTSDARVLVIATREDLTIVRETAKMLKKPTEP